MPVLDVGVIPSEARNLALRAKHGKIPRFARNDIASFSAGFTKQAKSSRSYS